MKALLLISLLLLFSLDASAQYSRSFSAETSTSRRHSIALNNGSTTNVLSIRNSSSDTLRTTIVDIDEFGNTSNYRSYEFSPFNVSSTFQLSGGGINSSGEITLCVLNPSGSGLMNVNYITLNPNTGNFSNANSLIGQFRVGFSRTQVRGDKLITYLANAVGSNTGIKRVASSMTNGTISIEDVDPTLTFSQGMSINRLNGELLIDGNSEYFALSDRIIKRTFANTYIQSPYTTTLIYAPNLALNANGELFVLKLNGQYELFDSNLSLLTSGTLATGNLNGVVTTEIYPIPSGGYRILSNYSGSHVRIEIDENFAIIDDVTQAVNFHPTTQTVSNGKRYIMGYSFGFPGKNGIDGNAFSGTPSSICVICDDPLTPMAPFTEYLRTIATNNLEVHVAHLGISFYEGFIATNNATPFGGGIRYQTNGSYKTTHFSTSSTMVGKSLTGDTIGSFVSYEANAVAGPYCSPGNYTLEVMDKYNRGYLVTREMIDAHITAISSSDPNYTIPFGILKWPAHGDIALGQAADLAGYVDLNPNGIYDPQNGDYPAIYGDLCVLTIFHQHPNTEASASIETHQYSFIFNCDQEEAVENTVFTRTENYARAENLTDAYYGVFADIDIGNPSDDFSGSNVELGMIYGYNGDSQDETSSIANGFGDTIPAAGILLLQGMKLNETGLDIPIGVNIGESINGVGFGDGIPDNEYFTLESSIVTFSSLNPPTEPSNLSNLYVSMTGLNADGTTKVVNGVTVDHTYFGTSDPLFYSSHGVDHGNNHSEISEGNTPEDRRLHCASGPGDFEMGDTMVFINAYVVGIDTVNLSPANSLNKLFDHGAELKDFFTQNSNTCGNNFNPYISDLMLSVSQVEMQQIILYPNPTNMSFRIKGITGNAHVQIMDLNGRMVAEEFDFIDGQEISIQELVDAVYLVTIEDEIGRQVVRLVKR